MFSKKLLKSLISVFVALYFVSALPWRELRADANIHGNYSCGSMEITYDQVSSLLMEEVVVLRLKISPSHVYP